MNWFDLTVSIALILAMISGIRKGLIMQLAGLAIVIISAVFGGELAKIIQPWIMSTFSMEFSSASVLSYIIAFLAISLLIFFLGNIVQGVLKAINLNFVNRLFGAIIGMGTMMVILSILLNLVLMIDKNEIIIKKEIKENTFFYERVEAVVPAIVPYLDKDVWEKYIDSENTEKIRPEEGKKTDIVQLERKINAHQKNHKFKYADSQRG
ncbi:MAG: CvpA family protein [Dysgonamonadaceae bacterium]|nr:CvpA family protein [Dysgonamonadaceae bacterium]MDD3308823.1 CvpA family protein [Dysgonamonadaceae bacterium]MDD3901194.1 CvpA family protein [Dysgonamonadaceae bacterium]MDD4398966.1 CvpA family protein [Dysgonamonadaceae bacterium]